MSTKREIVLVGSGGAGREFAFSLSRNPFWEVKGFVDDTRIPGSIVNGLPVFGGIDWLKGYQGNVAVCIVGNPFIKEKIINQIAENPFISFPVIKSPDSIIANYIELGQGTIIAKAYSYINPNVKVGKHVWINEGLDIGHDSVVGDFVTFFSNISVGGNVQIGNHCVIGTGAVIRPGTKIGNNVYIGGGAVVVKDIPDDVVVVGNPAKILRVNTTG